MIRYKITNTLPEYMFSRELIVQAAIKLFGNWMVECAWGPAVPGMDYKTPVRTQLGPLVSTVYCTSQQTADLLLRELRKRC